MVDNLFIPVLPVTPMCVSIVIISWVLWKKSQIYYLGGIQSTTFAILVQCLNNWTTDITGQLKSYVLAASTEMKYKEMKDKFCKQIFE